MGTDQHTEYVKHPLIRENTIESRLYQQLLAARILEKGNTLVVMPTALGKTIVAVLVAAERLRKFPSGKVLMLAPTKPLATQHAETFRRVLKVPEDRVVVLAGYIAPEKRQELWKFAKVICATPQTVENDILAGRISLEDVVLLVVDEAHRAVGDYPYVFIAREYMKQAKHPLILGLTASPGGTEERIEEVRQNLYVNNIEIKTPYDADVRPYIHKIFVRWIEVELPTPFLKIKRLLENAVRERLRTLKGMGIITSADIHAYSKKDYLAMQEKIRQAVVEEGRSELWDALVVVGEILKIVHALELLETQGIEALLKYYEKLELRAYQPRPPKSLKGVLSDPNVKEAINIAKRLHEEGYDHPKLEKLADVLREFFRRKPDARAIVFVQYRDTAAKIVDVLSKIPGIKPVRFVGQATRAGDKGMSQKEQQRVIQEFREGKYNVLVATSVAEEGLDIPSVDLVVFYEAIPSEIRTIQRRGRTGRFGRGEVVVLIAKGTRDEAYYWAAKTRERKMVEALMRLRRAIEILHEKGQKTILHYIQPERKKNIVRIIADVRERGCGVVKDLYSDPEVAVEIRQLPVGDYILSDRVVVERKSAADFVQSIIDGRLFEQAKNMVENFVRPVIVVEGDPYVVRNVHPNAIRGAIATLAVDYGIPVVFTRDAKETAALLKIIARREQLEMKREPRLRGEKRIMSLPEMQQYIVESLPFVGPKLAKNLLKTFGTVERVFTASERELAQVEGMGPKRAKEIRKVLTTPYTSEQEKEL